MRCSEPSVSFAVAFVASCAPGRGVWVVRHAWLTHRGGKCTSLTRVGFIVQSAFEKADIGPPIQKKNSFPGVLLWHRIFPSGNAMQHFSGL